jgi:hypothetical protein
MLMRRGNIRRQYGKWRQIIKRPLETSRLVKGLPKLNSNLRRERQMRLSWRSSNLPYSFQAKQPDSTARWLTLLNDIIRS